MRILTGLALTIFSLSALANVQNLDLINNSNVTLKVTYNLCTQLYNLDPGSPFRWMKMDSENCIEKSAMIDQKGKVNKLSIQANSDYSDDHIKTTEILITSISSPSGLQNFASSRKQINKGNSGTLRVCSGSDWTVTPNGEYSSPFANTIILDNLGTEKVYCSSHDLAS